MKNSKTYQCILGFGGRLFKVWYVYKIWFDQCSNEAVSRSVNKILKKEKDGEGARRRQ